MNSINFFEEDLNFQVKEADIISQWIIDVVRQENHSIDEINYIFCSDEYLLDINRQYLNHDYFTDIITFDHRDEASEPISSDIFISIDRVKENALLENNTFEQELHRVIIHGILHLVGLRDKTDEEKDSMREREEACLSLLANLKK